MENEFPPVSCGNDGGISPCSRLRPACASVINAMVDPDGTLDALASLGLPSPSPPSQPQSSPGSAPAARPALPQILPGPGSLTARLQSSSPGREDTVRDLGAALGLAGVGGLSFSRMRPSGEEAIAQK